MGKVLYPPKFKGQKAHHIREPIPDNDAWYHTLTIHVDENLLEQLREAVPYFKQPTDSSDFNEASVAYEMIINGLYQWANNIDVARRLDILRQGNNELKEKIERRKRRLKKLDKKIERRKRKDD